MAAKQLVSPPATQTDFVQASPAGRLTLTAVAFRFLTNITNALNGTVTPSGIAQVALGNGVMISAGRGSPNNAVGGSIGDLYLNFAGGSGTTLFVKESGVPGSNTGWIGK